MSFQLSSWCQEKVRQEIAAATPAEKAEYVRALKIFNRSCIWRTWNIEEQQWVIKQYEKSLSDNAPGVAVSGPVMVGDVDISEAVLK